MIFKEDYLSMRAVLKKLQAIKTGLPLQLALCLWLVTVHAQADHQPNFSQIKHDDHTQSVTRTTTDENIVISIKHGNNKEAQQPSKLAAKSNEQKALMKIYRSNLLKKTYQHVVYPESAIDKNHEGEVILKLTVDRNGKIKQIEYNTRARFNSLNKAASIAVKRAKPYPPVPKRLQGETFEISMPIRFRLTG
ncbi:MAG: energy transducer TonB [Pseudomonadales bacterium]|nr:energy transducer TonB [Gammaproteobacteria bacterium]NNL57369.1 energy transducer TonB [Pseudomonadales bacterium]